MGRQQASKIYKTKRYHRDPDRILLEDLRSAASVKALENQSFDEYLPGGGQHYCVPCAKHFESESALKSHVKSKVHKREIRKIKFGVYTPEEAAAGAGRDVEKYMVHKQLLESLVNQPEAAGQVLNKEGRKRAHLKRRKGAPMEFEIIEQETTISGDAEPEISI